MKIVKKWLSEFVSLPPSATDEDIARRLSLTTVEVENIQRGVTTPLDHIVVGHIVSVSPHPDADRLRIVVVSVGEDVQKTVVCGGSNLAVGMKVALALPGAAVRWHGEGELIILGKTTIRGVESDGMICASAEIGLADRFPARQEREILDISFLTANAGTPLVVALETPTVFEIDNKSLSHRPDLWGYRGMARELAAIYGGAFHDKKLPALPNGTGRALQVSVEDSDGCARYIGVVVEGVSYTPSPQWMQDRLRASGVRPITAIVDITNYVMLEYGQPMHAFDYAAVCEKNSAHIVVRKARVGERLRALDGGDYALTPDMLVIANDEHPLALAGVIGGQESAVGEHTTTVIFEAAHFAPALVRRTAGALRIATESSRRFEKDTDTELPRDGMARALQLCAKIFPQSSVVSAVRDVNRPRSRVKPIVLSCEDIERRLGITIPLGRAATTLKRLGFGVTAQKKALTVTVPSFRRKDIALPEDLMEELLRFVGYDSVPSAFLRVALTAASSDPVRATVRAFTHAFVSQHAFREVKQYAFVRPSVLRACGYAPEDHLELANPLSDERPFLCRSLLPNLLESLEKNQQLEKRHAFFEVNRVFLKEQSFPDAPSDKSASVPGQPLSFACVYACRNQENLFAFVAQSIRTVLRANGWTAEFVPCAASAPRALFSANRAADIHVGETRVGRLGYVSSSTRTALGLADDVLAAEVDISLLACLPAEPLAYRETGAFPATLRDITFVVEEHVAYRDIEEAVRSGHEYIALVEPLAVFRDDKKVGAQKKSISLHIAYRAPDRTLITEDVDRVHASIIALLKKKWHAHIR